MPDLSHLNPTGRFSGLADIYARCRPSYPDHAIDLIVQQARLGPGATVADVGCGTGISTRQLGERGLHVIGIEPNDEMRGAAQAFQPVGQAFQPAMTIDYRPGQAEHTGLPDDSCSAVVCAQAFHWFDHDAALREFQRILQPGGWLFLMWNERADDDPFSAALTALIRRDRDARDIESKRTGEVLFTHPRFRNAELRIFKHVQELDAEGLMGRAASISYAPRAPAAAARFRQELLELFDRYQRDGRVALHYQTLLYFAQAVTCSGG